MRLDKYLQTVGIFKRRTAAREVCEEGIVEINGHRAKSGKTVQAGDRIDLHLYNRELSIEVLRIPAGVVPKKDRPDYFRTL
ncbi:MAG: RNA-binding S4 domain-containing protein [Deltaproteobacteria bacterium]|nr:RNA-binding S4 domain-containing protein [Deltaproteobacteria bacterium]